MRHQLELAMLPQPNEYTCGPTSLHAVYGYYDDTISLERTIAETRELEGGGTLAVYLGIHALERGYQASLFTFNLEVFDPTWLLKKETDLPAKLREQLKHKGKEKLRHATEGYLEYLELGGRIRFEDLRPRMLRRYLDRGIPILTGLSATYLYQSERELPDTSPDDLRGEPSGHFVVLVGYDREEKDVLVADPLESNPIVPGHYYHVGIERLICSILLGTFTYDGNLLIIEPRDDKDKPQRHKGVKLPEKKGE